MANQNSGIIKTVGSFSNSSDMYSSYKIIRCYKNRDRQSAEHGPRSMGVGFLSFQKLQWPSKKSAPRKKKARTSRKRFETKHRTRYSSYHAGYTVVLPPFPETARHMVITRKYRQIVILIKRTKIDISARKDLWSGGEGATDRFLTNRTSGFIAISSLYCPKES